MTTIDTAALDQAVRRFPVLIHMAKWHSVSITAWVSHYYRDVTAEYRRILRERAG